MLVLWLSINLIWLTLHQQPSLNQVYNPETEFNSNYTVEVPDILSMGKKVPFTVYCEYVYSDKAEISTMNTNDSVSLTLFQENNILYRWNGTIGDNCQTWSTELNPGEYLLQTSIDINSRMIDGTLEYDLTIFLNFAIEGFFIANILGLLLTLSEVVPKNNKKKSKQKNKGKWKPKAWDIGEATKEVEVGLISTNNDEETIISNDVAEQRKKYEDEINKNSQELLQDFEVPSKEQSKELGEGDETSLQGKLKADERIQRVSDIYDLMEEK
tara:strand:- start:873 stop:1682 length:810 start_codon:yes stop_codon:yes gene_type:complete